MEIFFKDTLSISVSTSKEFGVFSTSAIDEDPQKIKAAIERNWLTGCFRSLCSIMSIINDVLSEECVETYQPRKQAY